MKNERIKHRPKTADTVRRSGDWQSETLARMRGLILQADPAMVEERKWKKPSNAMAGIPVWSHDGIVCTGETYQHVVKLTFAKGAHLADPSRLFNSSLGGNARRAIDIREGERVDGRPFIALVKAAVALNTSRPSKDGKARTRPNRPSRGRLLSGGNPQIPKGDGDAPVRAYLAGIPGWKKSIGKRLDEIVVRTVPDVRRAVKWNSPFYGLEGRGWFMSFHVFTNYLKVTFFRGISLRPAPPGGSGKEARWIDVRKHDFDEAQMARWVKQAASLPGWMMQEAPGSSRTRNAT